MTKSQGQTKESRFAKLENFLSLLPYPTAETYPLYIRKK